MSKIRMNFHADSENLLNNQINIELHASYVYQSMSAYFERADVALKGCEKFFHKLSDEEREHAQKIIKYINLRGGDVKFTNIEKPEKVDWVSCEEALESALQMEKAVYQSLLNIHKVASENSDPHLSNWLEEELLKEQVDSMYELSHHLTNIKRVGKGLGEYMFDKETLES